MSIHKKASSIVYVRSIFILLVSLLCDRNSGIFCGVLLLSILFIFETSLFMLYIFFMVNLFATFYKILCFLSIWYIVL